MKLVWLTVTPHKNTTGVIKVIAKRADVPDLETSVSLNISRPLPTISSVSQESVSFCNPSSAATLTASGLNAESIRWQPSALVNINGVNANTDTWSPVSVSASGEGHIDISEGMSPGFNCR